MASGTLFVVATPIGNRDDWSPRARQTLENVELIAAEDTRHTGRLLMNFGIKTPQIALHEHNEEEVARTLLKRLQTGASIALVSDAGTPLINDPGYRLVRGAHVAGIAVTPVPGPSAVVSALSVAGLPTDRFSFEGFLPAKREARLAVLERLQDECRSMVFFASVHKIVATLTDLVAAFGADRPAFLGRELSKLHEQCVQAPLGDLERRVAAGEIVNKGEFVLVVGGAPRARHGAEDESLAAWLRELSTALPARQAVDIAARVSGRRRNEVYRLMLALKADREGDS